MQRYTKVQKYKNTHAIFYQQYYPPLSPAPVMNFPVGWGVMLTYIFRNLTRGWICKGIKF
jgi:hypothetical protein